MSEGSLTREQIEEIVTKIRRGNGDIETNDDIKRFKEKYPNLYKMAASPKMDMNMLIHMLDMMDQIKTQQTTTTDASVSIGQHLFQTYVQPKLANAKKKDPSSSGSSGPVFSFTQGGKPCS